MEANKTSLSIGARYKNFSELDGLFTYEIKEIQEDNIIMNLIFPESWQVPIYVTIFNICSVEMFLEKIK